MGLGAMASLNATLLQRQVASCNDATAIRLWLSNGKRQTRERHVRWERHGVDQGFLPVMPLESSISAWSASEAPVRLLYLAFYFFIIGFGLYLLFLFLWSEGGPSIEQRKVLVFFTVVVGGAFIHNNLLSVLRATDAKAVKENFPALLWGIRKHPGLVELEVQLEKVQEMQANLSSQLDHRRSNEQEREGFVPSEASEPPPTGAGAAPQQWTTGTSEVQVAV